MMHLRVKIMGNVCYQGHPIRRPFGRYLRIELGDRAVVVFLSVKLGWADSKRIPPMFVCGKCLGIEK